MNIIESFNYITVCYNITYLNSVKLMIQEHYDTPEYENTLIFIDFIPSDNHWFFDCLKQSFKRRIFYFLEHKINDSVYHTENYYNWDTGYIKYLHETQLITEIWSMDYRPQFAVRCEQEAGIPLIYKPVRYTSLIKPVDNIYTTPKTVDFCLIGCLSTGGHRIDLIEELEQNHNMSLKCITQVKNIESVLIDLNTSKYILDVLGNTITITQNQVRIFELLCMGYTVCVEKCPINIFPGLIYEWKTVDDLYNIVKRGEYLHSTEAYKEMTYTDEAYEKYVNKLIELQTNVS